jgi:SHAQKYF class myb-like DNA-binding protein
MPPVAHTPVADPTATVPSPAISARDMVNPDITGSAIAANHPYVLMKTEVPKPGVKTTMIPSASAAPTVQATSTPATKGSSKSKKKKPHVTVTMATAATAQSSGLGSQGENTGRWTAEEHRLFLQGLEQHGKGWKKIASLIKSRTVVQIRTHAQKYFQKLAKARQNGEEGDVAMEGRGGTAVLPSVSAAAAQSSKRRRQTSGTKRKAIQSVVSSAQRQGKKIAAGQAASGVPNPTATLPAVAPALSAYVLPSAHPSHTEAGGNQPCVPSITTAQGTISGLALEDSLYVAGLPCLFFRVLSR